LNFTEVTLVAHKASFYLLTLEKSYVFFTFLNVTVLLVSIKQDSLFKAVGFLSYRVPSIPGVTRVTTRNAVGVTVYMRLIYRTDAAHAANG
jgi:hypothetical protein